MLRLSPTPGLIGPSELRRSASASQDERLRLLEIALVELILAERLEIVGDIDGIAARTVDAQRLSQDAVRFVIFLEIGQA